MEVVASPGRGPGLVGAVQAAEIRQEGPQRLTPQEAVALVMDLNLTAREYERLHCSATEHGADIYPVYHDVRKAKVACMPALDLMRISAECAKVDMQALMDHTCQRLLQLASVKQALERLPSISSTPATLTLFLKWGVDGSSGHSMYKQADLQGSDDQLLLTSVVPLRLTAMDGSLVWNNSTPSSPRFCRPISLEFCKETKSKLKDVEQRVGCQVASLQPLQDPAATVHYHLTMTMVDTKVVNALTDTSSQSCSMCGARPSMFNDLEAVSARPVSNTSYGLSILHTWIRVFEAVLHIAYRLCLQQPTHQVRKPDDKQTVQITKADVQRRLQAALGLRVDEPRSGGSGNSNDGNTARRAFKSPKDFAACTGVSEDLVRRLLIILEAVSCVEPLSAPALEAFCMETARLYVSLYPWYPMPPTLHRLLLHSAVVVEETILPIGVMSEEAAEALHKVARRFRQHHTRKDSRLHTMTDLFRRLLVMSDPVISSLRQPERRAAQCRRRGLLQPEVYGLLAQGQGVEAPVASPLVSDADDSSSDDE